MGDEKKDFSLSVTKDHMYCVDLKDFEVGDPAHVKASQRINFKCGKKTHECDVLFFGKCNFIPE